VTRRWSIPSPQSRIVFQVRQGFRQAMMENRKLNFASPAIQGFGGKEIALHQASLFLGRIIELGLLAQSKIDIGFPVKILEHPRCVVDKGFRILFDVVSGAQVMQVIEGLLARILDASILHQVVHRYP
jgi:hypothetical protein